MKTKELIKLLYDHPHMDVTYISDWNSEIVTSVKLVKRFSDGELYTEERLDVIRDLVNNYSKENSISVYNNIFELEMLEGISLESFLDMWGTVEEHAKTFENAHLHNVAILKFCDSVEQSILLV